MAQDRERSYSVIKMDEVKEKMKNQIIEISEIFLLSKSDAIVLLMYLRWDSLRVSERLAENKDKLLKESGLKSVVIDSNDNFSDASSKICFDELYEFADDNHDDETVGDEDLISTPFCSHKFSAPYWREYLYKNYYSVKKIQTTISCPVLDCRASVESDTIEKLPRYDQELYDKYVMRSYFEGNKAWMIKQCTARGCGYIIEFHKDNNAEYDDFSLNVVCLCGHTFCLRCGVESHRPVTCNNASDWLFRDLNKLPEESDDESLKDLTNTKTCPNCLTSLKLVGRLARDYLTCACSYQFCSWCLRSVEAHKKESKSFGPCRFVQMENSCADRWTMCETSLEQAKAHLEVFEESNVKTKSILNEQEIKVLREGLSLIVQCRRVLKWICVFDYFHTEYQMSKREYLRYLQGNAGVALQRYSNSLQEHKDNVFAAATTPEEPRCSNSMISIATSDIGNYFYDFIKTLQDGLADLKVKAYDDCGGPYWLCDRCTSRNNWGDKKCEMCRDETAAVPVEMVNDLSLN